MALPHPGPQAYYYYTQLIVKPDYTYTVAQCVSRAEAQIDTVTDSCAVCGFSASTLDNVTIIDYILLSPVALFYSATFRRKMLILLLCILII